MARDKFHNLFKKALEDEGWRITHDPLTYKIGKIQVQIDLGAERLIAAEKEGEKIAVEIKTFGNVSFITALYEAIGKFILYRNVLKIIQPERVLYLAAPTGVYEEFFEEPILKKTIEEERFKFIIFNPDTQSITKWIR